jgi:fatty acid desaturase
MNLESNEIQYKLSNFNQLKESRKLVEDLLQPKPLVYWSDLLLSAGIGWIAYGLAYLSKPLSWHMFVAIVVAAIFLYRAVLFIHEIVHRRANELVGFIHIWNAIVGIPLLFPSFFYTGIHTDHHRNSTYGTDRDPEYMPFAGKKLEIILFAIPTFFIPIILIFRLLILAPLGLIFSSLHHVLETYVSSLVINLRYCRRLTEQERSEMKLLEMAILTFWCTLIFFVWQGFISWHIFLVWYIVLALIFLMNTIRTLGAHRYMNNGSVLSREEQLLDSVDTPGTIFTLILAPVGLRFHALHHYLPDLPYHSLPIAYQRLIALLPIESSYCQATSPNLRNSLKDLWQKNFKQKTKSIILEEE